MQFSSIIDSDPHTPIIRASEISQYVFCQRSWWLGSIQGYRPVNDGVLQAGIQAHFQHGQAVARAQRWQRLGLTLLTIGGLLGFAFLCRVLGGSL